MTPRSIPFALLAGALVLVGSAPAGAQVLPSPALDQPKAPLAGPPPNQPPRQLPVEADPSSDPALANARLPPSTPGTSQPGRVAPPPPEGLRSTAPAAKAGPPRLR